ncbi:MAG: quinone-interacting membrane-bound oxidoreductase complex subunit QmoC [Candidatus Electryonea clarkiae]|nr:quinone-interacting membrane-bound oxidoreductase complex subunit QmoC [Candidatus Electryonea clarkiae]MDP8286566.1 quinone-interacting membrane-bound oxidoreductase complex subunit QmoC [Candidatus Electryonea clarkiae]
MQDTAEVKAQESPQINPVPSKNGKPVLIEPDLDFIQLLSKSGGDLFKKCMQCGTCSATCAISPDSNPFPRKEMAWAAWGMKDRLLSDPDVWLCYQCNDCSTRCPRGAKPGDLLAAVRQESVIHYAFPRFLGRWVSQPQSLLLLLGIPMALLALALYLKDPIENALGLSRPMGDGIIYSYTSMYPHWLLNSFFMIICFLALIIVIVGVGRFWQGLKKADIQNGIGSPSNGLFSSIWVTLKDVITHKNFTECTKTRSRYLTHMCVFFGFIALAVVSFWTVTARITPIIQSDFIYPFSFWSPWKLLANAGGLALIVGLMWMIWERVKEQDDAPVSSYFDWTLIGTLLLVTLTGFITELLHYIRLEPHRHLAYFAHLVFACSLLMYLPYSKFAHLVYRTTAMVYSEYTGRNGNKPNKPGITEDNHEEAKDNAE